MSAIRKMIDDLNEGSVTPISAAPRQGSDRRILVQYFARSWHKANDVVFTHDKRIRNALTLMFERNGIEFGPKEPIGWQGHFLFVLINGRKYVRVDMQCEQFEKAFDDLGYKKGKA